MGDTIPHRARATPCRAAAHLRHHRGHDDDRPSTPALAGAEDPDRTCRDGSTGPTPNNRDPPDTDNQPNTPPAIPATDQPPASDSQRWIQAQVATFETVPASGTRCRSIAAAAAVRLIKPSHLQAICRLEPGGIEPPTSCLQSVQPASSGWRETPVFTGVSRLRRRDAATPFCTPIGVDMRRLRQACRNRCCCPCRPGRLRPASSPRVCRSARRNRSCARANRLSGGAQLVVFARRGRLYEARSRGLDGVERTLSVSERHRAAHTTTSRHPRRPARTRLRRPRSILNRRHRVILILDTDLLSLTNHAAHTFTEPRLLPQTLSLRAAQVVDSASGDLSRLPERASGRISVLPILRGGTSTRWGHGLASTNAAR